MSEILAALKDSPHSFEQLTSLSQHDNPPVPVLALILCSAITPVGPEASSAPKSKPKKKTSAGLEARVDELEKTVETLNQRVQELMEMILENQS